MGEEKIKNDVIALLDQFMVAFNAQDTARWEQTFHFPHYRLANNVLTTFKSSGTRDANAVFEYMRSLGWHHSAWVRRQIVHLSNKKVHVDTEFVRFRADGTVIGSYESLYILTFEDHRWGVKFRSSFAAK